MLIFRYIYLCLSDSKSSNKKCICADFVIAKFIGRFLTNQMNWDYNFNGYECAFKIIFYTVWRYIIFPIVKPFLQNI